MFPLSYRGEDKLGVGVSDLPRKWGASMATQTFRPQCPYWMWFQHPQPYLLRPIFRPVLVPVGLEG